MGMTWAEIQTVATGLKPDAVGSVIQTDNAAISELAWYAWLVNMKMNGRAHKFRACMREYTLTLTSATEYNLATLIPDLQKVYQVLDGNVEIGHRQFAEFNTTTGGMIQTLLGKTLRLKEARSGTLVIPYISNYLVVSSSGTRQKHFLEETDESILYDDMIPCFLEGLMDFVYRKANGGKEYKKTVQLIDGRVTEMNAFEFEIQNLILNDSSMERAFQDFRYLP